MDANSDKIGKIIAHEWEMFGAVNKGRARADCQDDYKTFRAMRAAQFLAWSPKMLSAYLRDLVLAAERGRNLISEKYIHMMKTTTPSAYVSLAETIIMPTEKAVRLANEITAIMIRQTAALSDKYPLISGAGRPLYSNADTAEVTSVETYQRCELYTYSEQTLTAYKDHLAALEREEKSLPRMILENTVKSYGYDSLDAAEAKARASV